MTTSDLYGYPASSNRLTSITRDGNPHRAFVLDAAGNTVSDAETGGSTKAFVYDSRGLLKTVTIGASLKGTYIYNYAAQLVSRTLTNTTPSGTVHYIHDLEGNVIAETDGLGNTVREYIWMPSGSGSDRNCEQVIGASSHNLFMLVFGIKSSKKYIFWSRNFDDRGFPPVSCDWSFHSGKHQFALMGNFKMTQYRCKTCDIIQDFQPILRGNSVPCTTPNCIGQISHRNRYTDPNPYAHVSFATAKVSKSSTGLSLPGRSASAPPPPNLTSWPRPNMPNGLVYCQTLNDPNWNGATDTDILLAYNLLDLNTQGIQGLVIDFPNANRDTEVRKHFDACTGAMMTPKTSTATTEATGEIAAAMWVLSQNAYNGFKMVWGFNLHSGAGIDQIWYKSDPSNPVYLVVEAKGPGASLSQNVFQPPGYGQMEEDWVVDRLAHMNTNHGTLYNQIVGDLGLTIAVKHPNYNKGTKSYYHASQIANNRKGKMSGVTIEAKWLPSGMLSHKVASRHKYAFS